MRSRRVLVLDDERLVRWSLRERLKADGMEPVEAESVARRSSTPPGRLTPIPDYKLPDGDGLSVLRQLCQNEPDVPVIMLTAQTDVEGIVEAVKAGAPAYVAKPFDVKDVSLRLTRAIESTGSYRELRRLKEDRAPRRRPEARRRREAAHRAGARAHTRQPDPRRRVARAAPGPDSISHGKVRVAEIAMRSVVHGRKRS